MGMFLLKKANKTLGPHGQNVLISSNSYLLSETSVSKLISVGHW